MLIRFFLTFSFYIDAFPKDFPVQREEHRKLRSTFLAVLLISLFTTKL